MSLVTMSAAANVRHLLYMVSLLLLIEFVAGATRDSNLLMEIIKNLSPQKAFSTWNNALNDPCSTWENVHCDNNLNVISLTLESLGLSGKLSPEIGKLSCLQNLILRNNSISNSIPAEIGNLTQLKTLNLGRNVFSGSIPTTLEHLSNLSTLYLDHNNLTGQLPDWLSHISNCVEGNKKLCGTAVNRQCPGDSTFSVGLLKYRVLAGTLAGVVSVVLFVACFIAWRRYCLISYPAFFDVPGEEDIEYGHLKKYTVTELMRATNNFNENNFLEQGGFGKVYKGILTDETEVAVKRFTGKDIRVLKETFKNEVCLQGQAAHRNVLCLKGVCITDKEWILVYPYMPKKCVASCLKGEDPLLDWSTRKRIALGTARGLEYLHDHGNEKTRIIHRDIKAANILLDDEYEAKIGDFGLAKLQQLGQTDATTRVRGTFGYLAPEYLSAGKVSEKSDVFSYGMFLIELVTGQGLYNLLRLQNDEEFFLLEYATKLEEERNLEVIIDKNLCQANILEEVENMICLALLCTQAKPDKRPKMAEIVHMLDADCYGVAAKWHVARYDILMQPIVPSRYETHSVEADELSDAR